MTTFYNWLYLGQTQYDPDDLNKREKELAELAWKAAQQGVPEGWQLVPKEPTYEMIQALWTTIADNHDTTDGGYKAMLAAAPKFGEEE